MHTPKGDAQFEMLAKIDDFINEPDEGALREKFGFGEMLSINVSLMRDDLLGNNSPWLADYVKTHEAMMLSDLGGTSKVIQRGDRGPLVEGDGKTIFAITLPLTYSENTRQLLTYSSSSLAPKLIAEQIKELEHTVEMNAELLIRVEDEALKKDRRYFTEHDNPQSQFFHAIDNMYYGKFTSIKPKADRITAAIRKYLESK